MEKGKKKLIIIVGIVVALFVAIKIIQYMNSDERYLKIAINEYNNGNYEQAYDILLDLQATSEVNQYKSATSYEIGKKAYQEGDWEKAAMTLSDYSDFDDARSMRNEAVARIGISYLEDGINEKFGMTDMKIMETDWDWTGLRGRMNVKLYSEDYEKLNDIDKIRVLLSIYTYLASSYNSSVETTNGVYTIEGNDDDGYTLYLNGTKCAFSDKVASYSEYEKLNFDPQENIASSSGSSGTTDQKTGKTCSSCNGSGKKVVKWYSEGDWGETSYTSYKCPDCNGTGRR